MPSFVKRTTASSNAPPAGTTPALSTSIPPLYLAPTGIPSLDDIFGGGMPLGNVWMVLTPDRHTNWSRIVERYWTARGLVDGQKGLVVGEKGEDIVRGCMWLDEARSESSARAGSESEGEEAGLKDVSALGENRPKIAWRYDGMKKFETGIGKGDRGELNLLKTIPQSTISSMEKQKIQRYIPLDPPNNIAGSSSLAWSIMSSVLSQIQALLHTHNDSQVLRITVHNLGDIFWGSPSSAQILRFIHSLRSMVRDRSASVLVAMPADLSRSPPTSARREGSDESASSSREWIKQLAWSVDACIELKGFGDDPTLPPVFHPLHGLLTVHSLPTTHHVLPPSYKHSSLLGLSTSTSTAGRGGGAGENNLGFRLGRKRFSVETVHLGIEGGQGERRTEPVPDTSLLSAGIERPAQQTSHETKLQSGQVDITTPGQKPSMSVPPDVSGKSDISGVKKRVKGVRFSAADDTPRDDGPEGRVKIRHDQMDLYEF
ncbi:Elongator complex protein 4 [Kockovaella imperatae]|uniref:Elongator complex protein 4 n=1 Tax=Kockovaella imperatae TaxID=4999 RepID=A0A1Y1UB58_9TREE|nr:Elongator complex protein 4 [Kockovaella imperatae]ORX35273.1 Elongator complex protein 4 [Kockovaella imperatae]